MNPYEALPLHDQIAYLVQQPYGKFLAFVGIGAAAAYLLFVYCFVVVPVIEWAQRGHRRRRADRAYRHLAQQRRLSNVRHLAEWNRGR